ncbi:MULTISPECIES: ABC transporter permease [Anaerotruncus]|uniref:ABC transporter permease n=1 Tax=Anaerotruncus TaxID=244127 RepID=UPI0020850476|nr:ABC transporter permease [Anaerotruncus massiliensis (ex Togo et al. 2019)]GKH47486.1 ABC transporter permease [Oscillospiraceae bacterium]
MKKTGAFLLGFVTVNLLWLAAAALLDTRALPGPAEVYAHFGDVLAAGVFRHIGASLWRVFAGLFLALAVGVPVGLLMAASPRWNALLHPIVYFSYPVPKTALLPVAMLLFGLRDGSKILIILLTVLFQVIVATRDAARAVDPGLYQVAVSAGASRGRLLGQITLPAVLPELFTSLRIGVGTALAVLFIVEAYGTRAGIGYYILDAWSRIDYLEMYGGIVVISVVGAALFLAVDLLARRLCRWKEPS